MASRTTLIKPSNNGWNIYVYRNQEDVLVGEFVKGDSEYSFESNDVSLSEREQRAVESHRQLINKVYI